MNEVIPLCVNSIYLFYRIFPSTQNLYVVLTEIHGKINI